MSRLFHYQEQFNAGKLGALLAGRSDSGIYSKGCKEILNFRPAIQGSLIKRKGSVYISEVKDNTKSVRLEEFIFSDIDSYVLEFGENYIRFYQNGVQVESGGSPLELGTAYTEEDVKSLKFAQIGDIMYVASRNHYPRKISRLGATSWSIADVDNQLGPVEDKNETTTTITLSGSLLKSGASTWTASSGIFDAGHVGSVWAISKHDDDSIIGYAKMSSFTSSTIAVFTNQVDLTSVTTTATTNWREASWSAVRGYPRAVGFHEQRLHWGGTDESPLTIYGSVANEAYENYDKGTASADDALQYALSGRRNTIQWLKADGEFLVAGTYGGLAFVDFELSEDSITPRARVGSSYGSSSIQGIGVGDRVVYLNISNKSLYEATYDDISLKYKSINLSDYFPEGLGSGASALKSVEDPDTAAIMVSDGELLCAVRDVDQKVLGWYPYNVSGDIESVAAIPSSDGDVIYISVAREINGSTKRYIEYLTVDDINLYLDSSIEYSGVATRTFSGLDHLEGEEVSVYGNSAYFGDYTVASGSITMPNNKAELEQAYIGIKYNADMELMPISIPVPNISNTTSTVKSRIVKPNVLLYNTVGLNIGEDFDNLRVIPFRSSQNNMDSGVPAFGFPYPDVMELEISTGWSRQPTLCFRHDIPTQCTIVSVFNNMEAQVE